MRLDGWFNDNLHAQPSRHYTTFVVFVGRKAVRQAVRKGSSLNDFTRNSAHGEEVAHASRMPLTGLRHRCAPPLHDCIVPGKGGMGVARR